MFQYAKAIVGMLAAGSAALVTALEDGSVSSGEWLTVVVAALAALGVVFAVPNKADR